MVVEGVLLGPNLDLHNPIAVYMVWLIGTGIVSFFVYGYDKFKAVRGGYRIPEKLLHLLALLGGFLGCVLGMALFHHKTRKTLFKTVIVIAFLLHGFVFIYLFTS